MTTLRNKGLVLDFPALGLDPDDLGIDHTDDSGEIYFHDGPIIAVTGYTRSDVDTIRDVATWWDTLAAHAVDLATELRRQANSVCDACNGHGLLGPDDADCRTCSGSGTIA